MSFFDLDPQASANMMDQARMNPLDPETLKPGWFAGAWKAPFTGLASAVNDAAMLAGDAATPLLRSTIARPIDEMFKTNLDDWLVKEQQKAVDNIKDLAPDPRTSGTVSQAVHGLFNVIPEAVLGGPETAAVLQGYKGYRGGMADGLDPGTAFGVGAIDGISTWAGMHLPMQLSPYLGAAANIGSAAAINVPFGMASRGVTGEWLRSRGYGDMADQYKVMDSSAIAMDLIMGGGFGALAHYGPGAAAKYQEWKAKNEGKVMPSDQATAMYLNAVLHTELDTAPGIPADPAARAAHVEAVNQAITDLLAGRDVNVDPAVTESNFVENPTAAATRIAAADAITEHLGPDFAGLHGDLAERGLPTDPTLYNVTDRIYTSPIRAKSELSRLSERALAEGWSTEKLAGAMSDLVERMNLRDANRANAGADDRVRGKLWIEERLTRAERHGELDPEQVRLAKWLIDKNPNIANDLAISLPDAIAGAHGGYDPIRRLASIAKENTDPTTTVHEFLHHGERMMPDDVRHEIQKAWAAEVQRVTRMAEKDGSLDLKLFMNDVLLANLGKSGADARLRDMIGQGLVSKDAYALVNPSEFWAMNASRIIKERASESWVKRAVQWLKELVGKMQDIFGIKSDSAVVRGIDSLLKADGRLSGDVLAGNPIRLQNVEAPGQGVTDKNMGGFEPALRVKVPVGEMAMPDKPLIVQDTNLKNAARQIAGIDEVLAKFPDAAKSPLEWSRMMAYAMKSDEVVIPPYNFIKEMNSSGAVDLLSKLSQGQIDDANHGFENAKEYLDLYTTGQMDVTDTGKLLLWSFLSKGVSPYVQESMFLDAFNGIDPFVKLAGEGKFTKDTLNDYYAWANTLAGKGSGKPGAGTMHNLNGFGRDFLLKMNQVGEDGRTHLQRLHDLMADPSKSGKDIRREFHTFAEGVGIDNKVLSFTLLVTGRTDVMVLDRVQFRHLWDDGRFNGRNLYDGYKVDGKPAAGSNLSALGDGARGLLIYEAIERGLQDRIDNIYTALGRPQDASVGRYHWETWVADSAQEASHGSIDAVKRQVKGEVNPLEGVTAKEGQYDTRQYGARYGLDTNGMPFFRYADSVGKEYNFDVASFRAMLDDMKNPKAGVIDKNFLITDKRYEQQPWYTRPDVNRQALDALVQRYGQPVEESAPVRGSDQNQIPNGPGSADRPVSRPAVDPYSPEALMANSPGLTYIGEDGTMVSAARALGRADEEIAAAKRDSQGYDAAIACALRG